MTFRIYPIIPVSKPKNNYDTENVLLGVNHKPCEYCIHKKGYHYHELEPQSNSKPWANYKNDKIMCTFCMKNPGLFHIHFSTEPELDLE